MCFVWCCLRLVSVESAENKMPKSNAADSGGKEESARLESSTRSDTSETNKSTSESDKEDEASATDAENDGMLWLLLHFTPIGLGYIV